jgi:hypothetical protein
MEAPAETIYGLVSDVTRMGEWSPETYECEWIGGATGPAVGARFKARNKRRLMRWSNKPEVIAAEPGREFAFRRTAAGSVVTWRYTLEPDGAGTKVTESYEVEKPAAGFVIAMVNLMLGVKDRDADLAEGIRQTLERVKAAAEVTPTS